MADTKIEVNCSPGEDEDGNPLPVVQVEVPLTAAEKQQRAKDAAAAEQAVAAREAAELQRQQRIDTARARVAALPAGPQREALQALADVLLDGR